MASTGGLAGPPVDERRGGDPSPGTVRDVTAPFLGSSSELTRQRLRTPRYRRLSRDLYVVHDEAVEDEEQNVEFTLDLATRIAAALVVFPNSTVCLETAAAWLNLPVEDDGLVHLDRGPGASRSERAGIKVHRLGIPEHRTFLSRGVRVADGPRLVTDLSAGLSLEPLVVLGDQVLRRWPA